MQNKRAVAGIEPDSKNIALAQQSTNLPLHHRGDKGAGDRACQIESVNFTNCFFLLALLLHISLGSISDILISYKKGTILYREKRGLNRRLLVLY